MTPNDLFAAVVAAGIEYDSHESDLYVPVTPETEQLIAGYSSRQNVQRFVSQIDGKPWFDVPFAYSPFWERKQK